MECLKEAIRDAHDILDIGTSRRFATDLRPYESLFAGKNYIAAGYNPSSAYGAYSCDCHQDIQAMTFADESFDAVLCIEVMEHIANPFAAADEIFRVLRPGGRLLLTAPFLLQYHGKGKQPEHASYPDFWRFTHQGLDQLFQRFESREVYPLDGPVEFRLKQFYLMRALGWPVVRKFLDLVDRPRLGKATTRHLLLATK